MQFLDDPVTVIREQNVYPLYVTDSKKAYEKEHGAMIYKPGNLLYWKNETSEESLHEAFNGDGVSFCRITLLFYFRILRK